MFPIPLVTLYAKAIGHLECSKPSEDHNDESLVDGLISRCKDAVTEFSSMSHVMASWCIGT